MSATCKECAGSMERRGYEQVCYACLEKELADHKANHNTAKWTETLNKRMDRIAELEKEFEAVRKQSETTWACGHKGYRACGTCCDNLEKENEVLREQNSMMNDDSVRLEKENAALKEAHNKLVDSTCDREEAKKVIEFLKTLLSKAEKALERIAEGGFYGNDVLVFDAKQTLEEIRKVKHGAE